MYGILDFYRACQAQGVKPVLGTEAYMAHDHRSERPPRRGRVDDTGGETEGGRKLYYHLTLLAETDEGYRNLIQLASLAFLEGYYYKPRLDWELLERHHDGLIATTGCLGGHVLQSLVAGRRGRRAGEGGPPAGHLRARQPVRRAAGPRAAGPARHQPPADRHRPADRRAAARHQRQPLHAPRGPPGPRRAAVRADRCAHERPQAVPVRGRPALPEAGAGDALPVPRGARRPATTRCGSPSGPTSPSSSASPSSPSSRCPRASPTTPTTCAT